MATAGRFLSGLEGFQEGKQARVEAQQRKVAGERKLVEQKQVDIGSETEQKESALRLEKLELENQEAQGKQDKATTYAALRAYSVDGDPKHLQRMMTASKGLRELYQGVVSVDKLNPDVDLNIIRDSGFKIDPEMFFDPEIGPAMKNRYLKLTLRDGQKMIIDMQEKYASTGYTDQLAKQELEKLLTESKITKAKREAGGKEFKPPTDLTISEEVGRIRDKQDKGETLTNQEESFLEINKKKLAGTKPGQLAEADVRTQALVDKFGGEDAFFETDFGDEKNFRKAHSDIAAIELLEDQQFTSTEKTQLNDIRQLIALGDPSKGITKAETGLYDNFLHGIKKYISDEVGTGVAATSSYAAFRNSVRHALFGSALTATEIESFKEAFGTLGQKLGPVLQQFKTSLNQVKAKLLSIGRMKNPYSAHVRLGVDKVQLDRVISSIDTRIDYLNRQVSTDPRRKSRLDKIMRPNLGSTK